MKLKPTPIANVSCVQLRRLQYIHSRNFIHRDLKPSNIVMGIGRRASIVHLIDFGLSKEFRDPNTHMHIPLNKSLGFVGSATFASINSHLGLELGRRDDLESLAYILCYFLWGFLPWQGLELEGQDILESKLGIVTHTLFHGLPMEFRMFFEHCRSLPFDGKPDYDHYYNLFNDRLLQEGTQSNMAFEWDNNGANTPEQPNGKAWKGLSKNCQHYHMHSPVRRTGYVLLIYLPLHPNNGCL
jgi:serine/threonine protein kinase